MAIIEVLINDKVRLMEVEKTVRTYVPKPNVINTVSHNIPHYYYRFDELYIFIPYNELYEINDIVDITPILHDPTLRWPVGLTYILIERFRPEATDIALTKKTTRTDPRKYIKFERPRPIKEYTDEILEYEDIRAVIDDDEEAILARLL